ncbi:hypothetical protein MMC16_006235 [Acarospora aff. strigata]|nr:hypothetical protein [Acarospora aff. strigata]
MSDYDDNMISRGSGGYDENNSGGQAGSGYGSGRGDETSCGVRLNSLILIHKLKGEVFCLLAVAMTPMARLASKILKLAAVVSGLRPDHSSGRGLSGRGGDTDRDQYGSGTTSRGLADSSEYSSSDTGGSRGSYGSDSGQYGSGTTTGVGDSSYSSGGGTFKNDNDSYGSGGDSYGSGHSGTGSDSYSGGTKYDEKSKDSSSGSGTFSEPLLSQKHLKVWLLT